MVNGTPTPFDLDYARILQLPLEARPTVRQALAWIRENIPIWRYYDV